MEDRVRAALTARFGAATAHAATLENLGGHASLRIYWRASLSPQANADHPEPTVMAMVMPLGDAALKSEEGSSEAQAAPQELPFANVQRFLAAASLPVPKIELIDMELGVVLLEDLGSEHFEDLYKAAAPLGDEAVFALYQRAIALLVQTQAALLDVSALPPCVALQRRFDRELLTWELEHFREWGLHAQHGADSTKAHDARLSQLFAKIVDALVEAPQALALRDYQSRNIMHKGGKLVLIDFQDALFGPAIYDLVALLRDSYIELKPALVERLLQDYMTQGQAAGLPWCQDAAALERLFYLQVLQRKLKDAGRFIFIDRVKHNPSFLPYYEPSLGYVSHAISKLAESDDDFAALGQILAQVEPRWPKA